MPEARDFVDRLGADQAIAGLSRCRRGLSGCALMASTSLDANSERGTPSDA